MSKRKQKDTAPATKEERDARAAAGLCRTCKPPAPKVGSSKDGCCGVCWKCYRVYDRNKRAGAITKEQAIARGLISAPAPRGVKGGSGMEEAMKGIGAK
jgi:hypothetical protein